MDFSSPLLPFAFMSGVFMMAQAVPQRQIAPGISSAQAAAHTQDAMFAMRGVPAKRAHAAGAVLMRVRAFFFSPLRDILCAVSCAFRLMRDATRGA